MTLRLGVRVLRPKAAELIPVAQIPAEVDRRLAQFTGDMIETMAFYPPQLPPAGARQSLGKRFGSRYRARRSLGGRGYRRTTDLGRGWRLSAKRQGFVEVSNAVDYAVYVQGPRPGIPRRRQTDVMRARHWRNITDESRRVWARHSPGIASIFTRPRGRGASFRPLR